MWQKEHLKGHPRLVSINGDNLPSKNLSNIPLRYGEGMSSRNLILSCVLRPLIKPLFEESWLEERNFDLDLLIVIHL